MQHPTMAERGAAWDKEILQRAGTARPIEEWHEELGDCLWWTFPVEEPPYIGSPLDTEWLEDDHKFTHFTEIIVPPEPI